MSWGGNSCNHLVTSEMSVSMVDPYIDATKNTIGSESIIRKRMVLANWMSLGFHLT